MNTVSTSFFGMLIGAGLYDSIQDRRVVDAFLKSDNTQYDQSIEDLKLPTASLLLATSMAFTIKRACYAYQKAAFIKGLNNGTRDLEYASEEYKGDREVVLAAVAQNGYALKYASEDLRGDREVVLVAVGQNGAALQYALNGLRGDREVVLAAVSQNGAALQYALNGLRGDRNFVLEAVGQDGSALQYAPDELRGDRNFVLEAVGQNGDAFYYASPKLKDDREIVLAAVAQKPYTFLFSLKLQSDPEIVLAAVVQDGSLLECVTTDLRGISYIVLAAVAQNGSDLNYATERLKVNPKFNDQLNYMAIEVGKNGQTLLRLYKELPSYYKESPLFNANKRLAFAKLMFDRLAKDSAFALLAPDIIEHIMNTPPLTQGGTFVFEKFFEIVRELKPKGIPPEMTIEQLIKGENNIVTGKKLCQS